MSECEVETVPVAYTVTAEFDDQAVPGTFGPVSNRDAAESILVALASREDVKKATLTKGAVT